MRRRVGTAASATPRKRGAERRNNKVFMNVCTVFFFGMVRAQRGEAEPSPPPYVYSLPGLAPPMYSLFWSSLCVLSCRRSRVVRCGSPSQSARSSTSSFVVGRVQLNYNECQNQSAGFSSNRRPKETERPTGRNAARARAAAPPGARPRAEGQVVVGAVLGECRCAHVDWGTYGTALAKALWGVKKLVPATAALDRDTAWCEYRDSRHGRRERARQRHYQRAKRHLSRGGSVFFLPSTQR